MAKMAKQKQTDYTKGGKLISDTSVPLYASNLGRIDEYLSDPQKKMNKYLTDYYDNTVAQSDFLRNYKRAMSGQTGLNYSATTGGYTSEGQRAYNDQQIHQNDLAARLRAQGVISAYNMASGDFGNMLSANNAYHDAYGLGRPYSDVEQYNYLAKQNNSFGSQAAGIGGGLLKGAGAVVSAFNPALGMGLMGAGSALGGLQTQVPGLTSSTSTQGVGVGDMFGGNQSVTNLQKAIAQQGLWGQNRK